MVKIVSDSTADLSAEFIEKYNLSILPLHVLLGEDEYIDGININNDKIFEWADANKTTPKTSAPSQAEAIELFEKLLDGGNEIVAFSISSSMSASFNVMRLAAEALDAEDRVFVIDSKNLSSGIALQVLKAAELAMEGKSGREIADEIAKITPFIRSTFVVDTLTYLHRGGRCSGVAAMAGGMLKLHPIITVSDGKMGPGKKYRGKMSSVLMEYVKDLSEDMKAKADPERIFVTTPYCDPEDINNIIEYIKGLGLFKEVIYAEAGGVIASHCGPGTVGILYQDRVE